MANLNSKLVAAIICLLMFGGQAFSQTYPAAPIKIIVPFGPGSGTDIFARMIGDELRAQLGATVIVDNRPGANGIIAAAAAAKAPADGYTLLFTTNATHSIAPATTKNLSYDPIRDFEPIALFAESNFALIVKSDFPASNQQQFVEWIKQHPSEATYGFGNATGQIGALEFTKRTNLTAIGVPYKSTPQAITDMLGGQIKFMITDLPGAQAQLAGGGVKALAVTGAQRSPLLPEIPTLTEEGLSGFDISAWLGLFAPAGTPETIIVALNLAVSKMQAQPGMREKIRGFGSEIKPMSVTEFREYVVRLQELWAQKVKFTDFTPQP